MKFSYKQILSVSFLLLVIGVLGVLYQRPWQSLASIDTTQGYYSTTTPVNTTGITTLVGYGATGKATGILGSVIVTGSNGGNFYLYDATTSDVNRRTGNKATTTIMLANIPAGATSTTYVYDSVYSDGLLIVPSGSISTTTITWK